MMQLALTAVAVLVPALLGPVLVRRGAAVMARAPQAASIALLVVLGIWLAASASLIVALAGAVTGPQVLPAPFADVCQRCLAAATPFASSPGFTLPLPAAVPVLLPLLGLLALTVGGTVHLVARTRSTRSLGLELVATGRRVWVGGREVLLIPARDLKAFTLPRRHGGIVVSQGLLDVLDDEELCAVIEHEHAHLRLHHHEIMAVLQAIAQPLRVVPLVRAVQDAIPHLVEIAADDLSRQRSSTSALASALLILGTTSLDSARADVLLHATGRPGSGPDRIRHLVAPAGIRPAVAPALLLMTLPAVLVGVAVLASWPYATLLLTGCTVPA